MRSKIKHGHCSGYSLIEILIVLAVLGLAAMLTFEAFHETYERYRLEAGARELGAFLASAPGWSKDRNAPVFVLWQPDDASVVIAADAGGTVALDTFDLAPWMVVTPTAPQVYRCDTWGRAFAGTSPAMLTASQVLTVTHREMAAGDLDPLTVYRLTLSPLWNILTDKQLV